MLSNNTEVDKDKILHNEKFQNSFLGLSNIFLAETWSYDNEGR